MRITNGMVMKNYLKNLNNNMTSMTDIQNQVSSGKRLSSISDDPVDAISIMQYRVKLYKTEQYSENVDRAMSWLGQTESSAMELNEIIKSAYETAVEVSNDYLSSDEKTAAAELIGQLRDHVLTIGNAKSGDRYIFGGNNVNKTPFSLDGGGNILFNGLDLTDTSNAALLAEDASAIEYELAYNMKMDISVTGSELLGMGEDNIYTVLDNMYNALMSDSSAEDLSGFVEKLKEGQSHVLSVIAEIGGRTNRMELIQNRYDEDNLMYTDMKSKLEDVDQAEAIMNFKMAEYVYSAALQIGSKVIQPSLVDFLN